MCVDDRRVSVQQERKYASKEREKNRREKESERKREREKERKIVLNKKKEKENVSGRKYLADQVDYWSCCSIRDDLNGNLSQNTS